MDNLDQKIDAIVQDWKAEAAMAHGLALEVGTIQRMRYETALLRLMRRTGNNTDLVNALNNFLIALDANSYFGAAHENMSEGATNQITEAINKAADEVRWACGAQPSNETRSNWRK
jgi:hypothetical protein